MHSSIPNALVTAAVALCVAYAALGAWLWRDVIAGGEHGLARDARTPHESVGAPTRYRVRDADGREHLLTVSGDDPAWVLTEASKRFGFVTQVEKISAQQAQGLLASSVPQAPLRTPWLLLAFAFPLAMWIAARAIRTRERQARAVFDALSPRLSGSLGELERRTGLSRPRILAALARLRRRGPADFVYHESIDWIADARLHDHGFAVAYCPSCNEPTGARVRADLIVVPSCPVCINPYPRASLAHHLEPIADQLRAQSMRDARGQAFSPWLFAALCLLLPPAALLHAWFAAR